MDISTFDLMPIPSYNGDVEAEGDPAPVRELKERIRAADAVLVASLVEWACAAHARLPGPAGACRI